MNERQINRAVRRAEDGKSISEREAIALLGARGDVLGRLVAVAGRIRDQGLAEVGRAGVVTYSPKVFIPLTRLCRDRCSYCTFATDPADLRRQGLQPYLSRQAVVEIAAAGAEAGCTEALFTMGDAPELRWSAAQKWLDSQGHDSTLSYLRASAVAVLEETGLLPHLNPGVMSWQQMQRLRPVAPSMGMMLETTSRRLFETPGEAHYGSPDKDPRVRLQVLADAGRASIPFTTGLLVGIGETRSELVDSILAIRNSAREFGHIQEVLIQNFRAKPGTAHAARPDLNHESYLATIATSRVLLGPKLRLQAPPNLSEPDEVVGLVAAGIDDLGGISPVTPDHVNPERPWPAVSALADTLSDAGFELVPRLAVHPEYVADASRWVDPKLHSYLAQLADPRGLAERPAEPRGLPWQEPDPDYTKFARRNAGGRIDLSASIDVTIQRSATSEAPTGVFGDWGAISERAATTSRPGPATLGSLGWGALQLAERDPAALALPENHEAAVALMSADGPLLEEIRSLADHLREQVVGDPITYVVNRNINFTNVCYTGCRFCAFAQRAEDSDAFTLSLAELGERVNEATANGATEICMQGGIHPDLPGTAYFDLVAEVKKQQPQMHVHAFSPMEIVSGAAKSEMTIADWLKRAMDAGLNSIPGTAAEILDDDVRWVLTKGKLPTADWIEVVTTAHGLGLPSSATMMYGHVDRPDHWVRHLATIRGIQQRTGGFTEFVPLPFVHQQSPIYLAGVARPGPTIRENAVVHAMSRIMLHGAIDNIQCSWVKLGPDGCAALLNGGANDLGGTLMEETISRMAGSEHGVSLTPSNLEAIATKAGRFGHQRTTLYGNVGPRPDAIGAPSRSR
jgi:FO synthase